MIYYQKNKTRICFLSIILIIAMLFSACTNSKTDPVFDKASPNPNLFYSNSDFNRVAPDENKHIKVNVLDEGVDVYAPAKDTGYRYGPSLITYTDGSIDAWFASPGTDGEWDWITYRHYDSVTKVWSNEVSVLQPTPDSMDNLSCCDPGVIYFNGYYYLGYTSTIDDTLSGVRNNVYVARSKNPDGPYDKWNGTGWGGKPQPIIYFDEDSTLFGAGEPSFVELEGKLFIYFTWRSATASGQTFGETRVATADATNENWPLTIENKGTAIKYVNNDQDSADVKYVENYGKFIAICTNKRFTESSMLSIYESNDGITFTRSCELKTNIVYKCHNSGISGRPNGHINTDDDIYAGYAYGENWGCWGTRIHKISIELVDKIDLSDGKNKNTKTNVALWDAPSEDKLWVVGVTALPHQFMRSIKEKAFTVDLYWQDTIGTKHKITDISKVKFARYDDKIIKFDGFLCTPKKVGETLVTAVYEGRTVDFYVKIYENSAKVNDNTLVSWTAMQPEYTLSISNKEQKQIRGMSICANDKWKELFRKSDGVTYSGYDETLIKVSEDGIVRCNKKEGTTDVTVTYKDKNFTVKVNIVS